MPKTCWTTRGFRFLVLKNLVLLVLFPMSTTLSTLGENAIDRSVSLEVLVCCFQVSTLPKNLEGCPKKQARVLGSLEHL